MDRSGETILRLRGELADVRAVLATEMKGRRTQAEIRKAIHETAEEMKREPQTKWWPALWDRLFPGEAFDA